MLVSYHNVRVRLVKLSKLIRYLIIHQNIGSVVVLFYYLWRNRSSIVSSKNLISDTYVIEIINISSCIIILL